MCRRATITAACLLLFVVFLAASVEGKLWPFGRAHTNKKNFVPLDHCFQYLTCQDCIAADFCGWCSNPVVGGGGAHCAGFSPVNGSSNFICHGTYQTTSCITPSASPTTAPSHSVTATATPGPSATPKPVPPPYVTGLWRGLQINNNYTQGEWHFNFTNDNVTISGPVSSLEWTGIVYSDAQQINIHITEGKYAGMTAQGIFEIDFGPVEYFLTLGVGIPPSGRPSSWDEAMSGNNTVVWALERPKQLGSEDFYFF